MACSYQRRPPFWTGLGLDGNAFSPTRWERETEGDKGRQRETEGDKGRRRETKGDRGRQRETKGDRGRQRVIVVVRPSSTDLLLSQGEMGADLALNHSIWYEFVSSEDERTCETE